MGLYAYIATYTSISAPTAALSPPTQSFLLVAHGNYPQRPSDGRRGAQRAGEGRVSEHVGVGGLEELDIVLQAAVGAVRLLQAVLHVLQSALVPTLHLGMTTSREPATPLGNDNTMTICD